MSIVLAATFALTTAAAVRSSSRTGFALSAEGEFASAQVTKVWDHFESTYSNQTAHSDLLADVDNLLAEHSLPGWDGADAPAVSFATAANAREFILALPDSVQSPELAVDPDDGAISFEWYGGYRKVFSVSVGERGRLACAGLDGTDQWYGAWAFNGKIPTIVIESIQRVLT